MTLMFWTSDRATEPPMIELLATEDRKIAIGLSASLAAGESVVDGTIESDLALWRNSVATDQTALIASQRVDASKLPVRDPVTLRLTFQANTPAGIDFRAVYVVLYVSR
jgi:hypothetical protein